MKRAFPRGLALGLALSVACSVGSGQVIITEFMAANDHALFDEDGEASDWIEIYNPLAQPVQLGGWSITDQTNNPAKWQFPSTNLPSRSFIVVFASGKNRRTPGRPLHTNFKLDADGEYLALIAPDGVMRTSEFAPAFTKQYTDISYGAGETRTLLSNKAPARVFVPKDGSRGLTWTNPSFSDADWMRGTNGVGYETVVSGFAVRVVKANVTVNSLAAAETVLATPSQQAATWWETAPVINYINSGDSAHYQNDRRVPGLTGDADHYVIEVVATVTIPAAGYWTFGVSSDDGFGLDIGGNRMVYPDPRAPDDTLDTFHFASAGKYPLRLVFYEQGGGSEVELWAASGRQYRWSSSVFRLVGDTASGGLAVVSTPVGGAGGGSYRADIHTDVESIMLNKSVSAYVRLPFDITEAVAVESLTLKIKYDDGFVAYLNGTQVAQRNAPSTPAWNTPATANHSANADELIDLSPWLNLLSDGPNLLAIHGLNRTAESASFLVLAELQEFRVAECGWRYFAPATPGQPNLGGYPALAEPVQFSVQSGVYTNNLRVTMFSSTPGAAIRYTLDNKVPTEGSTLYTGTITVQSAVAIRARAFVTGLLPSQAVTVIYTVLDKDLLTFDSNLPLIILNTYGRQIDPDLTERVPATMTAIDTKRPSNRARLTGRPDYHGRIGIEGRGQTSWWFPKKPYNVELRRENDDDLDASLLGMPPESDWVLLNLYNDKTFMNDFLAHELFEQMGRYSVRRRFVEVFLNGARGEGGSDPSPKVGYDDYAGIYLLLEKIKVGPNRVNIAKLDPTDLTEPGISGGYVFKKDKDSPGDMGFGTSYGQYLKFHDPKGQDLTQAQRDWLASHINKLEAALYGSSWLDPSRGYLQYIDSDSFVDNHWIVEFTKQIDGYRLSNYLQKDRGGRVKMEPIWDWNLSFGNADYYECEFPQGWYWPIISSGEHIWLRRLIAEPGAPDFNQKIIDRWSVLRTNVLNASRVIARMDELAALLSEAQERDFTRWPRLGQYVWPNPPGLAWASTYDEVLAWVKSWVSNRYAWIESQFVQPPTSSLAGGLITAGTQLNLSAPSGTIWYMLDGSDPRAPGGSLVATAQRYAGPITLNANCRLFARARVSNQWSGPLVLTFYTRVPELAVTEIMYHPALPAVGGANSTDDFQFIELMNVGPEMIDLKGFSFARGIEFMFSGGTLAPGQRVVLVHNESAFESRYGPGINIGGVFTNSLAHGGERLTLVGPFGEPVLDFTYDDAVDPITDGYGFSLVKVDENAPLDTWDDPAGWRRSGRVDGTPGQTDVPAEVGEVLINEILTHSVAPQVDAVELYNPTDKPVDVSEWFLTDDLRVPAKFAFPTGSIVPARGYLVIDESQFNPNPGTDPSFAFGARGEQVGLFSADTTGQLTGHMDGLRFKAAEPGVTLGRYTNSIGQVELILQRVSTLGAPNSGPRVGPVVINEIHYLPAEGDAEFIELKNITGQPVELYDPQSPTNTWRIDGVDFQFPAYTELPPCGLLLLVGCDPAWFRARYSVPADVTILGLYSGALDGDGELVELLRPESSLSAAAGRTIYVTVDSVHYRDQPPWPCQAVASGSSLERICPAAHANDPINWRASAGTPSPGRDNPANQPPLPPRIESVELVPGQTPLLRLRFVPELNRGYVIQYTERLKGGSWHTLQTITPQPRVCPVEILDPLQAGFGSRYYRVLAQ